MIFSNRNHNHNYKRSTTSGIVAVAVPETIVRPPNPSNTRPSVSSRELITQILPQKSATYSMLSIIQTPKQSCCGGAK